MANPYAPPGAEASGVVQPQVEGSVQLPGMSKLVSIQAAGLWSGPKILVGGVAAPKAGRGKVTLTTDDGRELVAHYRQTLNGGVLVVGTATYPIGPRVPTAIGILVALPLALVLVGGLIGGLMGGMGTFVNAKIVRQDRSTAVKVALMLGVSLLATFGTLLIGGVISLLIKGKTP